MLLSIIAPCFNEESFISSFLESIDGQTIFKNNTNNIELIIVDGGSDDRSVEYIKSTHLENISNFHLVKNSNHSTPSSLNTGIKNSSGKYIIRLDIHANYPKDYCELLLDFIESSDKKCGNVGFPIRTLSITKDLKSSAIAATLSSKLGVGNSAFRTIGSFSSPISVDTVPFGCFKREILDEIGLFDEFFHRNQDDELNLRIKKHGYNIYLLPSREAFYYCRRDFKSLFLQYYQFGYYKPFVGIKHRRPSNLRQFFPPLLTFSIITLILASFINFYAMILLSLFLLLYLLFAILIFINLEKLSKINPLMIIFLLYALLTLHFSYGLGYLKGSFKILYKRLFHTL